MHSEHSTWNLWTSIMTFCQNLLISQQNLEKMKKSEVRSYIFIWSLNYKRWQWQSCSSQIPSLKNIQISYPRLQATLMWYTSRILEIAFQTQSSPPTNPIMAVAWTLWLLDHLNQLNTWSNQSQELVQLMKNDSCTRASASPALNMAIIPMNVQRRN